MKYSPKEKQCKCGKTVIVDKDRIWCTGCANPVYYHDKDQNKHKKNHIYMMSIFIFVFGFLAYVFLEMIIFPTLEIMK